MHRFIRRLRRESAWILLCALLGSAGCGDDGPGNRGPYRIGGTVEGLQGTVVLRIGGGNDFPLRGNGTFTLPLEMASGTTYSITVASQPSNPDQVCEIENGTGTVRNANVTNIVVRCVTRTYQVGGAVVGLAGSGLVLQVNGGSDLPVTGNGAFRFPGGLEDGTSYSVTVLTQPSGPAQECNVTGGTGTLQGGDATQVVIVCTTTAFSVRVSVSGLEGRGLVLVLNGATPLAIEASGTFSFSSQLADGSAYAVTVRSQPTSPIQRCAVAGGSGTVAGADVTGVAVTCTTQRYTVGGSVLGLVGSGLVLRNGGADDLAIATNGPFTFATPLVDGSGYAVSVANQPVGPRQRCSVSGGFGTVSAGPVSSVVVRCETETLPVGGRVIGLAGSGLVLRLNGLDSLPVSTDGVFTFPTRLPDGTSYQVTVAAKPTGPSQTCTVASGAGVLAGQGVTSVLVSCETDRFAVGGAVSGLAGSGLVLQLGGERIAVSANGAFSFGERLPDGSPYDVQVALQPTALSQTCTVGHGAGTLSGRDVSDVDVRCTTNRFVVGGTVSGLSGAGLVLRQSGGDDLAVAANGDFVFPAPLADGSAFSVTVAAQPVSPNQTCVVSGGTGTVAGAAVRTVAVECTTTRYAVGGTVSGLAGMGLVLQISGGDGILVSANGTFSFPQKLADGSPFAVTVAAQPVSPRQTCSVTAGSGTLGGADIDNVAVTCVTETFTVGGTVHGVEGAGLVLQQSGADDLPLNVTATATFTFPTPLDDTSAYAVSVKTHPSGPKQTCVVNRGTGTLRGENVSDVDVRCVTDTFTLGGNVSGLAGGAVVLRNEGGDDLVVSANGSFTFPTPLPDGTSFAVTVAVQPRDPSQTCTVTGGTGSVGGGNVTGIAVACVVDRFTVGGEVTGLRGTGLVLRQGGGDDLAITADGTFVFATSLADGSPYAVTVATQPSGPTQTCTVVGGSGTLEGGPVTTVTVICTGDLFTVGGTVSGLEGSGLVLQQSGGEDLAVDANGTFTFPSEVQSGRPFTVTVATQPSGPVQRCIVDGGTGTVRAENVTAVRVTCVDPIGPVVPTYPQSGAAWNDYLLFDGTSLFDATDTACSGMSADRCFHAGQMRSVDVTGRFSDCAGLSAEDGLGAFDWTCAVRGGKVELVSTRLKRTTRLSDLLDFSTLAWRPNDVVIRQAGVPVAAVPAAIWWSNPVVELADEPPPPPPAVAAALEASAAGTVHLVRHNLHRSLTIDADKMALVVRPGVTLTGPDQTVLLTNMARRYVWIEGSFDAAGYGAGIFFATGTFSVLRGVSVVGAASADGPAVGIRLDSSSNRNRLVGVRVANNAGVGILSDLSTDNHFEDVIAQNNALAGIVASRADRTTMDRIFLGNHGDNVTEQTGGLSVLGTALTLTNVTVTNNPFLGLSILGEDSVVANVTATNQEHFGVVGAGRRTLFHNVAAANNRVGLLGFPVDGPVSFWAFDVAATDNREYGVLLPVSEDENMYPTTGIFKGVLKVGNNTDGDCHVLAGATGLTDLSCAPVAPSNATVVMGVTQSQSFVGRVLTDDPANATDANGAAAFSVGLDWFHFANEMRGWGADAVFPTSAAQGRCGPAPCRIWDWSLVAGDTGDGGGPALHNVFPDVPAGSDVYTATMDGASYTFLRHATELSGDFVGNDNGLCESNERCLLTPNLGSYQGHGNLVPAGTFSDGTLTGITLLRYEHNGRER